jgi:uncharacterized protein with HEPN domain
VREDLERLDDIRAAIAAIDLERGTLSDGLVYDAVRVRLIEIGEAVKDLDPALLVSEPTVPWGAVAGMRDHLAHRYFDTDHAVVTDTVQVDLPLLAAAVGRLRAQVSQPD